MAVAQKAARVLTDAGMTVRSVMPMELSTDVTLTVRLQPCTPTSNGRMAWKVALYTATMPCEATGRGSGTSHGWRLCGVCACIAWGGSLTADGGFTTAPGRQ
jgi:hypothetical protein